MTVATPDAAIVDVLDDLGEHRSLWSDVWRQFRRHKGAMAGLGMFIFISLAVIIGPFVYPYDPYAQDLTITNQGASLQHIMGTDNLGRDALARLLIGGRISLAVGFAAMAVGLLLGTLVGVLAGFFKRLDGPLMRLTDLFLSLPQLPLLLVIIMLFREPLKDSLGPNLGIFLLVVFVIGITASWMNTARVVRGDVLAIKEEEFVLAARSIGTKENNIVLRHILPNVLSSVTVAASLGTATAIITESALSFLGLGFPADFPTWGRLLSDGTDYLQINPWRAIGPGALISLTVLSVNFVGDGLRDALDPRLRSKG
ncbi:MAG: ABC transporter permease [Acidimicrobiia bacterium]|nr:ABC transporter permease [Acidimicrobiia bacterium]